MIVGSLLRDDACAYRSRITTSTGGRGRRRSRYPERGERGLLLNLGEIVLRVLVQHSLAHGMSRGHSECSQNLVRSRALQRNVFSLLGRHDSNVIGL